MKLLFSCALLLLATGQAAASKKHHRQLTEGTCLGDISKGLVAECDATDCLTCANALSDEDVLKATLIFDDDLSQCLMGSTVKVDLKIELDNKSDNTLFDLVSGLPLSMEWPKPLGNAPRCSSLMEVTRMLASFQILDRIRAGTLHRGRKCSSSKKCPSNVR